jgi:hypothetical protein
MGAACAYAALVRDAQGVSKYDVMNCVGKLLEDKAAKAKCAALTLYARLFSLGPAFEYYAAQVLPQLLKGLGDKQEKVAEAADACCKTLMAHLSPHGAKLLLPGLLEGAASKAWKRCCVYVYAHGLRRTPIFNTHAHNTAKWTACACSA